MQPTLTWQLQWGGNCWKVHSLQPIPAHSYMAISVGGGGGGVIPQKSSHSSSTLTSFDPLWSNYPTLLHQFTPPPIDELPPTLTTKWEDFREDIWPGYYRTVITSHPRFRSRPKLSYDQTMQTEVTSDQTFQTEVTSDQTFQTKMISDQTFQTKMSSDQTEPRPLSRL